MEDGWIDLKDSPLTLAIYVMRSISGVYRYAKDKWIATGRLDGEAVSIGIFTVSIMVEIGIAWWNTKSFS